VRDSSLRIQALVRGWLGRRRASLRRRGDAAWASTLDGTLLRSLGAGGHRPKGGLGRRGRWGWTEGAGRCHLRVVSVMVGTPGLTEIHLRF
jgi:hypothetical protein